MPRRKHILNVRLLVALLLGLLALAAGVHVFHLHQFGSTIDRLQTLAQSADAENDLDSEQRYLTRYLQFRPNQLHPVARLAVVRDELALSADADPKAILRAQLQLSHALRLVAESDDPQSLSTETPDVAARTWSLLRFAAAFPEHTTEPQGETPDDSNAIEPHQIFDLRHRLARAQFALGQLEPALQELAGTNEARRDLLPATEPNPENTAAPRDQAPTKVRPIEARLWRLTARCYVAQAEATAVPQLRADALRHALQAYRRAIDSNPSDLSGYDPYGLLKTRDPAGVAAEMTVYEEKASTLVLADAPDARNDADDVIDEMVASNRASWKASLAAYRYYRDRPQSEAEMAEIKQRRSAALAGALEHGPNNRDVLLVAADEALRSDAHADPDKERAWASAESYIQAGSAAFPDDWRFSVLHVRLSLARGNTDQAQREATEARQRENERAPGKPSLSVRALEAALAEAFLQQGMPHVTQQILLPEGADDDLLAKRLASAAPQEAYLLGRSFASQGDFARALRVFEAMRDTPLSKPLSARMLHYLGFCYERIQQPDLALERYTAAADVPGAWNSHDEPLPHLALARVHAQQGEPAQARRWLARATAQSSNLPLQELAALRVEIDLQERRGRPPLTQQQAQRAFSQMTDELETDPATPALLRLKAKYFAAYGHFQRAIELTEQARAHGDADNVADLVALAELHRRNHLAQKHNTGATPPDAPDSSEAALQDALEKFPDDPRPRIALARARAAQDDSQGIDHAERLMTEHVAGMSDATRAAILEAWGQLALWLADRQLHMRREAAKHALDALEGMAETAPPALAPHLRSLASTADRLLARRPVDETDVNGVRELSRQIHKKWTPQPDDDAPVAPAALIDVASQAWLVLARDDATADDLSRARQQVSETLAHPGAEQALLDPVARQLAAEQRRRDLRHKARSAFRQWAQIAPDALTPRALLLEMAIDEQNLDEVKQCSDMIRNRWTWQDDGRLAGPGATLCLFAEAWRDIAMRKQDLSNAGSKVEQLRSLRPQWPPTLRLLALLEEARGNHDAAIEAYQRHLELPGFDPVAAERLILLLSEHRTPAELLQAAERMQAKGAAAVMSLGVRGRFGLAYSLADTSSERATHLVEPTAESRDPKALIFAAAIFWRNRDYDKAEQALTRAIELDNQNRNAYISLAVFYTYTRRPDEANQTLANAQTQLSGADRYYVAARSHQIIARFLEDRARAQTSSEDAENLRAAATAEYREAAKAFRDGLNEYPDDLDLLDKASAFFLIDPNQAPFAEELLTRLQAHAHTPDKAANVRRLLALAIARDPNRWDEALKKINRNLPDDVPLAQAETEDLRAKAMLLAARNTDDNRTRASQLLEELMRRSDAAKPADRFLLARLYYSANEPRKGRDQMLLLLASDRNKSEQRTEYLRYYVGVLLSRNELQQAANWLRQLESLQDNGAPADAPARQLRALLLARQQRDADALDHLKPLLEPAPNNHEVRLQALHSAVDVLMTGSPTDDDFATVQAWVDRALQDDPENVNFQIVHANFCILREQTCDQAYKRYRELLDGAPKKPLSKQLRLVALNNIAWILSERLGDQRARREEALKYIAGAIREFGAMPDLVDTQAVILTRLAEQGRDPGMQRVRLAIKDLQATIERDPRPIFYYHLAQAYWVVQDRESALTALAKAKQAGAPASIPVTEREAFLRFDSESQLGAQASR